MEEINFKEKEILSTPISSKESLNNFEMFNIINDPTNKRLQKYHD